MKKEKMNIAIISTICFILLLTPIASFASTLVTIAREANENFYIVDSNSFASTLVTITGEVNERFQIVDSYGDFYEIADTGQGSSLAEQHSGEIVAVTGTVEVYDGIKIITVEDFEVLAE